MLDYELNNYSQKQYLDNISEFLAAKGFKGTYSMIYPDISEIYPAFLQCRVAFDYLKEDHLITGFKDQYVNYILNLMINKRETEGLLYPGLKDVLQKDKSYGLELINCLQKYIICGQNVTAAAELLHVHRHTVIYRLNNIKQIMNLDFGNLEEDSLLHIYISCRLLNQLYCH